MSLRRTLAPLAGLLCLASWASPARAESLYSDAPAKPASGPSLSVGAQLFSNFHAPTSHFETEGFDITRARIYAHGVFNDTWSGHVVYNTRELSFDKNGKLSTSPYSNVLEMAYLQAQNLYPASRLQLGMIIEPWFEYEAKAWGYRMLGFLPSAGGISSTPGPALVNFYDDGLSLTGSIDAFGLKKVVGYSAAVLNGEGNHAVETDGQLDYQGRLTLSPLEGLELTGMADKGNPGGTAPSFERYAGLALYGGSWGKAAFEGNWSHDDGAGGIGSGQILGGWLLVNLPFMPVSSQLVLRGDRIDGDSTSLDPSHGFRYETIAGIAFMPVKQITLMLDNENADWHHADGSAFKNTDQVALHTSFSF